MNKIFDKVQKASIEVEKPTPLDSVGPELAQMKQDIVKLLTTDHPVLKMVAQYYLDLTGT